MQDLDKEWRTEHGENLRGVLCSHQHTFRQALRGESLGELESRKIQLKPVAQVNEVDVSWNVSFGVDVRGHERDVAGAVVMKVLWFLVLFLGLFLIVILRVVWALPYTDWLSDPLQTINRTFA